MAKIAQGRFAGEPVILLAQEEANEWSPEKLKMVKKNPFFQNCPGTFGVSFAIITGTREQV